MHISSEFSCFTKTKFYPFSCSEKKVFGDFLQNGSRYRLQTLIRPTKCDNCAHFRVVVELCRSKGGRDIAIQSLTIRMGKKGVKRGGSPGNFLGNFFGGSVDYELPISVLKSLGGFSSRTSRAWARYFPY